MIICILVAVVIIPRWRTPRAEKELPANPYTVPLALTLVLVVVYLLDRACALLCVCWKRSAQVIFFVAHCAKGGFMHLPRWSGGLLRVISRVGSSTLVTVWMLNVLFGASVREVGSRLR